MKNRQQYTEATQETRQNNEDGKPTVDMDRLDDSKVKIPDDIRLLEKKEANNRTKLTLQNDSTHSAVERIPRTRLIDALLRDTPNRPPRTEAKEMPTSSIPGERRSQRLLKGDSLSPLPSTLKPWSQRNPDWAKDWRVPLVHNRATIDKDDIPRLDEGEFLNDNIIEFYIRYLFADLKASQPEVAKRLYFFNSFFFDKLKPVRGRYINYEGVKSWTAKVDLFSYDYIVVPVNESTHWWVAIICNPGKMDPENVVRDGSDEEQEESSPEVVAESAKHLPGDVTVVDASRDQSEAQPVDLSSLSIDSPGESADRKDEIVDLDRTESHRRSKSTSRRTSRKSSGPPPRKYSVHEPRIITLDSMSNTHSPACSLLKQYLVAEFKDKKKKSIEYTQSIGMTATNIPQQGNFYDCGVYLLGYIQQFLKGPDKFVHSILQKQQKKWHFDASGTRNELRKLIFDLHDTYQAEQEELKRRKKLAKMKKRNTEDSGQAANLSSDITADEGVSQGSAHTSAPQTGANSPREEHLAEPGPSANQIQEVAKDSSAGPEDTVDPEEPADVPDIHDAEKEADDALPTTNHEQSNKVRSPTPRVISSTPDGSDPLPSIEDRSCDDIKLNGSISGGGVSLDLTSELPKSEVVPPKKDDDEVELLRPPRRCSLPADSSQNGDKRATPKPAHSGSDKERPSALSSPARRERSVLSLSSGIRSRFFGGSRIAKKAASRTDMTQTRADPIDLTED
jgi:hypothetical protein